MIPKSFIQDLLNRIDIVDTIERHIRLKKAGANYVACCPFHSEKSPSFTVSPTKQFYHCFGCGAHGNALSFTMEHLGIGYVDAIHDLANSLGLTVPNERGVDPSPKIAPDLYDTMQAATQYYREQLKSDQRAINYLKQRGLSGEIAARFAIGYAPDGWQSLATVFRDYQDHSLQETGLIIQNDEGKRYDRFRDRIMFPITNVRGQVIGFGGRVLDKGEPKYLNSPETPLFEKGRELYGLHQAQKSLRAEQRVLVVEGYMDVVALAQHGVDYAVATLGTATTATHIQKLLRLVEHIIFCFDGDQAGQRAAWRALENALPHLQDGKRLSFLFLPEEHDPDSYIREYGKAGFEQKLEEALPLSGYLLREISNGLDFRTPEDRNQLLQRAKPLLAAITAPATALLLRKEVAALSSIEQYELESLYEIDPVRPVSRNSYKKVVRTPPTAYRLMLQCILAKPELGKQISLEWHAEGPEAEAIMALLVLLHESEFTLSGPALTQQLQDTVHAHVIAQAEADMLDWGDNFDVAGEFNGLMNKISESERKAQIEVLQAKLAQQGITSLSQQERTLYLQLLQQR